MSAFGVKGPLLKAVITENFKYNSSEDILNYLSKRFETDEQKCYFHIPAEEIVAARKEKRYVHIPGCVKEAFHMLCFLPDGSVLTKVNICSCDDCLEGNFLDCSIERGNMVVGATSIDHEDDESDSDVEYEDEDAFGESISEEMEMFELRSESVVQAVKPGNVAALFSPPNSLELFYLCKVIESGVAIEDLCDIYNHYVSKGTPYLLVNYFEKKSNSEFSKNGHVIYRLIKKSVYVLPAQVMSPNVNVTYIGTDVYLLMNEYQWLSDMIGQF